MASRQLTSSDQYTILRELGKGGFGKVFLVKSKTNPEFTFAIKAVDLERVVSQADTPAEQAKYRKMALEEAEKMKTAEHPFIVRVFGSFLEGDIFYIAMEYCNGGTLKQAIGRQNGQFFEERKILLWTAQLALTLKFLHDRNILHRDIKSENVFLIANGEIVKLGDFGIAKSLDQSTSGHTFIGTVTHMPPEMWQDKPYTRQSEVWELGIVVYELCALRLPFDQGAGGLGGLYQAICVLPIKPLPEVYSHELRSLVLVKLLERNIEKRPSMIKIIGNQCVASATVEMMPMIAAFSSSDKLPEERPSEGYEGLFVRKHVWETAIKRAFGRSWDKLYTVLTGSSLMFYKDQKHAKADPRTFAKGQTPLDLNGATVKRATDYTKRPHVIRLRLANGGEFLLQARDDDDATVWLNRLGTVCTTQQAATTSATLPAQPSSSSKPAAPGRQSPAGQAGTTKR